MNVIIILMDTLRRDHLGIYGNRKIKTPSIDNFAQRSTIFDQSYLGSYPCMPARQDLWTGRCNFPWRGWSPLEYDSKDIVAAVREQGYVTQLITDHYHLWHWGSGNYHMNFNGVEFIRGQESDSWNTDATIQIPWPTDKSKIMPIFDIYYRNTFHFKEENDYFSPRVFQSCINWIEKNHTHEKFFLMVDSFDPHEPWDTPEEYWRMYDPDYSGESYIWPPYGSADRYTAAELKNIHARYCGEITLADKWFGKFIDKLDELGLFDNTMIVLTTDHGFLFGEHNYLGKHAPTLFEPISHTPLIIYHPHQRGAGRRVGSFAQLYDLYPTILEAIGANINPMEIHGHSLLPVISETDIDTNAREAICFGSFGGAIHLTDGEWTYVRSVTGTAPLYWHTQAHYAANYWPREIKSNRMINLEQTKRNLAQWSHGSYLYSGKAGGETININEELYQVSMDPCQIQNVASLYPNQCRILSSKMKEFLNNIKAPESYLQWLALDMI
ncbi:sulfatase [Fodinisporobacter ferrooxydans]|uniref:Sulfatase n=1 Tax=Fodinisporobacter ferrooxydans TaxID=2901836 RepID=A0ABY4CLM4_9BACL|nr:sulfatase [Alicyclobacillaceae bacterium MYW30-H2]